MEGNGCISTGFRRFARSSANLSIDLSGRRTALEKQASLSELTPHVGTARDYRFTGYPAERNRYGNCYAFHLFAGGGEDACVKVDGMAIPIEKGTLVFIRPGVPHSFHIPASANVLSHNVYCDLWLRDGFVSDQPMFTFPPNRYRPELATLERPCPGLDRLPAAMSLAAFPRLYDNFAFISRTFDEGWSHRRPMMDSLFHAWLLELHDTLTAPRAKDRRIVRVLRDINADPERAARIESILAACGLKKSYFYKLFKEETGMPVHEYIIRKKLEKAAVLLQETDITVTEVAEMCGYTSVHHFSRQFKAKFGAPPPKSRSRG